MSLAARSVIYFNHSITARFRLSPAPSSAKEVRFLLQSFRKVAPVDYFHVQQTKFESHNPFRHMITVMFNASEQSSQLKAFSEVDPSLNSTSAQLQQRQNELVEYIKRICGVPRFSYVENDDLYLGGKSMVPFRHKLLPQGDHLQGGYDISASNNTCPFFLLSGSHSARSVLPFVRHNFQRLHKIELLNIELGLLGLQAITGIPMDTEVPVNMNHVMNTAALINVDASMSHVAEKKIGDGKFRGFNR